MGRLSSSATIAKSAAAGEGKLSFLNRIKYAMDSITSFSYKPLRLSFAIGGMGFVAAFVPGLTALVSHANSLTYSPFAVIFLMNSFPLFGMGILGEYMEESMTRCGSARYPLPIRHTELSRSPRPRD